MTAITKGSEKQIAWAEKIKIDFANQINRSLEQMRAMAAKNPDKFEGEIEFAENMYADALKALDLVNDAKWLIDRRNLPVTSSSSESILNALVPGLNDRINARPEVQARNKAAEENAAIQKAAIREELESQIAYLEIAKKLYQQRVAETSEEYTHLEEIANAWTDEQIEGEWTDTMYRNTGRREQILEYQNIESVLTLERIVAQLQAKLA